MNSNTSVTKAASRATKFSGSDTRTQLHKVTMNLSAVDVSNAERLRDRLQARSNAQVVSTAIAITSALSDLVQEGSVLMVRDKKGELQRIVIPGFS